MLAYLKLLKRTLYEGDRYPTGTWLPSEERRPSCLGIFAAQFRHDLDHGFPALTTKKLQFESVVKELLWFLRGDSNIRTLGCGIWNAWADPDGETHHLYPEHWRRWVYADIDEPWRRDALAERQVSAPVGEFDQIANLVAGIRRVRDDPNDRIRRRLIVSAWNPPYVESASLPACHTLFAVVLHGGDTKLSIHCFWRSIDAFLGMGFNVASYAILLHLLCGVTGLRPGTMVATINDLHIYDNHFDAVGEQLARKPFPLPELAIDPAVWKLAPDLSPSQVRALDPKMFRLVNYKCHGPLRAEVAI